MAKRSDRLRGSEWRPPKPLWRFGWRGWALLPVAIALAVVLISGIDGRYYVLRTVQWLLGTDAMLRFVTAGLPFHAAELGMPPFGLPPGARFGLLPLCFTLIAMGLHPRWFSIWAYLAVTVLGLLIPPIELEIQVRVSRAFGPGTVWGGSETYIALGVAGIVGLLATGIVLGLLTRSRVILVFVVVTGALAAWLRAESWTGGLLLGASAAPLEALLRWVWNPAPFTLLLWWAIGARRAWRPRWACQSCGYDLRGTSAGKCPECGGETGEANPAATKPEPGG